jgi:hypothetical protein
MRKTRRKSPFNWLIDFFFKIIVDFPLSKGWIEISQWKTLFVPYEDPKEDEEDEEAMMRLRMDDQCRQEEVGKQKKTHQTKNSGGMSLTSNGNYHPDLSGPGGGPCCPGCKAGTCFGDFCRSFCSSFWCGCLFSLCECC